MVGKITRTDMAASLREENVDRLKTTEAGVSSTLYLHLKSLFAGLEQASAHARGRLLDLGCGNKPYRTMFAGRVSEHVGCDMVQSSEHCVDILCPATAIPMADETFDTVLCTQVIEHVAEHKLVLREAFRLLKPGGILILSAPMYWPLHEEPYDFFRFTRHGLDYLLKETGFNRVATIPNGGKWALAGQALVHCLVTTRFCDWAVTRNIILPSVNRAFGWLDDHHCNHNNPMNYVVVASRPARS
jgi:2-polyprenyl-3-methyl-5-hydroxy-6-metoxy-1,4-benzoquinol methylase